MKYFTIFFFLILVFVSACDKTNKETNELAIDSIQLDSVVDYYVNEGFFPFIYARLEDLDGNVIYEHGKINNRLMPNTTVDGDSWIRIWSMSKIVTISLALDLVEEGKLDLKDPVIKYIPEFENLKVAVTNKGESLLNSGLVNKDSICPVTLIPNDSIMSIGHLLNHEAGFYYATTGFDCLDSITASLDLPNSKNSDEVINKMAQLPLIQHSGAKYFYGTNTTVLGFVLERITGKSLNDLVIERITEPMNIEGLAYRLPVGKELFPTFTGRDSILRIATKGELDIFGPSVPDYNANHELYLGGEGMLATANGYADFIRMLLNRGELNGHRYLETKTVEEIYAPHTQKDNPYGYNGYNLWISGDSMRIKEQGEAGLWIGGGYECTYFWADPKRNFVGIIMSQNNKVRAPGYEIYDEFKGILYKQFWKTETKTN